MDFSSPTMDDPDLLTGYDMMLARSLQLLTLVTSMAKVQYHRGKHGMAMASPFLFAPGPG
jgi:hypothetical protein